MFGDENGGRQDVIVDEGDAPAGGVREPSIAGAREPRVRLFDHRETTGGQGTGTLDHVGRVVARAVVHQHHFVLRGIDGLIEARR